MRVADFAVISEADFKFGEGVGVVGAGDEGGGLVTEVHYGKVLGSAELGYFDSNGVVPDSL